MRKDKTNPKYLNNPKLHLRDLIAFYSRLQMKILGEEDKEWREELKFLLGRTNDKIKEVRAKIF